MAPGDNTLISGDSSERRVDDRCARGSYATVDGPLRVSPALAQIAERLRTRFGVVLEVLSRQMMPVLPAAGGELHRAVEDCGRTQAEVLAALEGGRTRFVDVGGSTYALHPLRHGRAVHNVAGVLAIRREEPAATAADATEPWLDFLKTAIEADFASNEGLRDERLNARRTSAALRFIGQLVTIDSEGELARAVVHAAAVWFDVDARLYRRDLAGDFVLHTHLPGVGEAPDGRLNSLVLGDRRRTIRLTGADNPELRWASPDALLVPIVVNGSTDWVLVLGGVLPEGAQVVFETVAQTMGSHLSRLGVAYRTAVRRRFESVLLRGGQPRELVALDTLRQLIRETGAGSGVVTLFHDGGSRRLAEIGDAVSIEAPQADALYAFDQFVVPMPLGGGRCAVLQMTPPAGATFPDHAPLIVEEVAPLLQVFLAGALRQEPEPRGETPAAAFETRIAEELARAKRFDLGLSMLLVEVEPHAMNGPLVGEMIAGMRAELRGSDLLGLVGPGQIAALLVHTDVAGVAAVVERVRRRLALLLRVVGLPELRLGRAVLSTECQTASELLSRASRDVEAVVAA